MDYLTMYYLSVIACFIACFASMRRSSKQGGKIFYIDLAFGFLFCVIPFLNFVIAVAILLAFIGEKLPELGLSSKEVSYFENLRKKQK